MAEPPVGARPREFGGAGLNMAGLTAMCEALGRRCSSTRAPDGTVTISAPLSTAGALLSLLQGLTELVAASAASAG